MMFQFHPIARLSRIIPPLLFVLLNILSGAAVAGGNTQKQQYNIPPQPLAAALQAFSDSSHLQLLYDADLVAGMNSLAVKGAYTPGQALAQLLGQSGLGYQIKSAHMVTLTKRTGKDSSVNADENLLPVAQVAVNANDNAGSDTTLPKVTVEADSENPYDDPTWQTDPYNTDYVLPKATAGTKTNTPVMETPLNVQVISKQVLKDQQVISLDKALKNVSGVVTTKNAGEEGAFGESIQIRGFGTNTLFRNGFRLDGSTYNNGQQFANVESVEVLKGAASVLYGRVELGGMVNVVTKQPRATPYYSLNQQFGSYDLYRTSIDATGPLTKDDTLLYRVNASYQSNHSFRDLVSNEDVFFAPVLKWNISPQTQATLEMEYQREISSVDTPALPFENNRLINLPHNRNLNDKNPLETQNIFVGFNWSHQFNDDWSFKHLAAYKGQEFNQGIGAYVTSGIIPPSGTIARTVQNGAYANDTVATVVDLTGHFKTWALEHTLLFGGDYYSFDDQFDAAFALDSSTGDLFYSNINYRFPVSQRPTLVLDSTNSLPYAATNHADQFGLYFQDQIKLPYNMHVSGGIRYQYASVKGESSVFNVPNVPDAPQVDDAVTPRVGVLWQPQKWLSLYGNYVENFGLNLGLRTFSGGQAVGNNIPAQTGQQWEIGSKFEFFNGRLRAQLAYYDITKQNVATPDAAHPSQCNSQCYIINEEVRSRGPEVDIQGEILPGWNMIATYTNQDVRVAKSKFGNGGSRLQFVPRNIGSFFTTYEFQQGPFKGLKFGGGIILQDSVVDAGNTFKSPGYGLVNFLTGYSFEVGKSKITAQLNIDNLLDKSYVTNVTPVSSGNIAYVGFSTPRTFMGSINVEY